MTAVDAEKPVDVGDAGGEETKAGPKRKRKRPREESREKPQSLETKKPKNVKLLPAAEKKKKKKKEDVKNPGKKNVDAIKKKKTPPTEEEKREAKKKQKELKEQRQKKSKSEDVYALGVEIKRLWESARREDLHEKERTAIIGTMFERVRGNVSKIVFAHDTVRAIECLVAMGGPEVRKQLLAETKDQLKEIAKSAYGHFFVVKLLKYGDRQLRKEVYSFLEGSVAALAKHKVANNVLEAFYNEYAGAPERNRMLQEFCGPEFRAFKEDDVRTVQELVTRHPEKERDIVKHLGGNVTALITKGCYNHTLVHTVIYNYLQVCSAKARAEIIEQLRDVCLHVLHSRDGARLSMMCLWYGTAKDRKAIVKNFKTFVTKICSEEHGHKVLLAMFDSVDDTKLVSKAIIGEMAGNLKDILAMESGRKVLMYLLAPRDKTYFHPQVVDILKQGDGNEHSKKDDAVRQEELREAISPPLCKLLIEDITNESFFADSPLAVFVGCVINHATHKSAEPLMVLLAEEACKPFVPKEEPNLVEDAATHLMLKRIIAQDKARHERDVKLFSDCLLEALDEDALESWVSCNRGAFLLVAMMETDVERVQKEVKNKVKKFTKTLAKEKNKGAEVLRKKLEA